MEPIAIFLICMAAVTVIATGLSVVYAIRQAKKRTKNPRALTFRARIFMGERSGLAKGYEIYVGKLRIKTRILPELYHLRNFKEYLTEQLKAHGSQAEVQIIEVGP